MNTVPPVNLAIETEWFYLTTPEAEQRACFLYEYSRESTKVRELVAEYRRSFRPRDERLTTLMRSGESMMESMIRIAEEMPMYSMTDAEGALVRRIHEVESMWLIGIPEFPLKPWPAVEDRAEAIAASRSARRVDASSAGTLLGSMDSHQSADPLKKQAAGMMSELFSEWSFFDAGGAGTTALFRLRLDASDAELKQLFWRAVVALRADNGITAKKATGGRRGDNGLPCFQDAMRTLGAMRVLNGVDASEKKELAAISFLQRLGFQQGKRGSFTSAVEGAAAAARTAAKGCRKTLRSLFGADAVPLNWPASLRE